MTAKKAEQEPILSGAHLAPDCDRDLCDGDRTYPTPNGPFQGHCWCPEGRRDAEYAYAHRHNQPVPALPGDVIGVAS